MSAGFCPAGSTATSRSTVPLYRLKPSKKVSGRAADQLVGHDEDLPPGGIDHRRAGDADRRADIPAGQVTRRHRGPDVGRPQHRPGVGRQRVDGVVLRRHEDAAGGLERLAVDLAVEGGRRPGRVRGIEGDTRGVRARAQGVAVVHGPRRGGVDVRHVGSRRLRGDHAAQPQEQRDSGGGDEQGAPGRERPRGPSVVGLDLGSPSDGRTVTRPDFGVDDVVQVLDGAGTAAPGWVPGAPAFTMAAAHV